MAEEKGEKKLAKDVMQRLGQLENIRRPWESMWEEIIDYVIPRLGDIRGRQKKGQKQGLKVYDGTAITTLELLADGFHGYLVSPSMQWFRLRMANRLLEDIPEVKEWLQEAEKTLYSAFQRSNYYEAMSQYFHDGGPIGTATGSCGGCVIPECSTASRSGGRNAPGSRRVGSAVAYGS